MRIYKFIHSCLVVEEGGDKILFDPGMFSFMEGQVTPDAFRDVGTIIITHNHPDHVDVAALKKIVELSGAMVITNSETKDAFTKEGIEAIVLDEGSYQSKDFTIRAVPANHEKILAPTLPQNTAYIINESFLNPGDSFVTLPSTLRGIKALALVVAAPWTTELTTAEFAETIAPQMVIPVHDGYVKSFFQKMRYDNYDRYFSTRGIKFQRLVSPGEGVEIEPTFRSLHLNFSSYFLSRGSREELLDNAPYLKGYSPYPKKTWIKPSSPLSNNFQKQIGQFSRQSDHRIMARWQLSQTPPRFRWRKCSPPPYIGYIGYHYVSYMLHE